MVKVTRADLVKTVQSRAKRLGEKPALSKLNRLALQTLADQYQFRLHHDALIEEATWMDRNRGKPSETMYESVVKALFRDHRFSNEDLYDWSFKKLQIEEKPATEYISMSCRASVWTKYVNASIVLNDRTFEVKNICVWSETNGI